MKNLLKINVVAIVAALSLVACHPPKATENEPTDTIKQDSARIDSDKKDLTNVKPVKDTNKTAKTDTLKK